MRSLLGDVAADNGRPQVAPTVSYVIHLDNVIVGATSGRPHVQLSHIGNAVNAEYHCEQQATAGRPYDFAYRTAMERAYNEASWATMLNVGAPCGRLPARDKKITNKARKINNATR